MSMIRAFGAIVAMTPWRIAADGSRAPKSERSEMIGRLIPEL
jgi:hypothetical protein